MPFLARVKSMTSDSTEGSTNGSIPFFALGRSS